MPYHALTWAMYRSGVRREVEPLSACTSHCSDAGLVGLAFYNRSSATTSAWYQPREFQLAFNFAGWLVLGYVCEDCAQPGYRIFDPGGSVFIIGQMLGEFPLVVELGVLLTFGCRNVDGGYGGFS